MQETKTTPVQTVIFYTKMLIATTIRTTTETETETERERERERACARERRK